MDGGGSALRLFRTDRVVIAIALVFIAASGCKSDSTLSSTARGSAGEGAAQGRGTTSPVTAAGAPRDEVHAGVRFLLHFRGGADDDAPLVVAIHGRGDNPDSFSGSFRDFTARARFAYPQAPEKFSDGFTWFPGGRGTTEEQLAAAIDDAEKRLWPAIVDLARGRRIFVTGFSQGGMLSYVLAARHPREIAYAFPIAGGAPGPLLPRDRAAAAPIYALHGSSDPMIEVQMAERTVAAFREAGATVMLRQFAGVGHTITGEMRADLFDHLRAAIEAENARPGGSGSAEEQGRPKAVPRVDHGDAAPKSL
jgi:phospholipase/carboxylesterase